MKNVIVTIGLALLLLGGVTAQAADEKKRNVPPLTERVYKQISEAQLLIDPESVPVEDGEEPPDVEPNPREGIAQLTKLLDRRGINSYERAQIWNTLAFGYYTIDDTGKTIEAYENVLKETITEALELSALRALFQLHYAEENYERSLEFINRWQALKETPDPDVMYIKATVFYQLNQYDKALDVALEIERVAKAQERTIKESWWYLQVVLYNEMDAYQEVIPVLEKLIKHYPKKQYWMHLAGMYGETEQPDKALSAYYAAYKQDMFDKGSEVVMLAQRLLNAEVPFEAAQVLEKGIQDGLVEENLKNLKLLATAYTMAQEMDDAIGAWRDATQHAEDGQVYYRLAQALSREDRHEEAVDAYRGALDVGDLDDTADVQFWLGISLMQLERWDEATRAFRVAAKDEDKEKSARQYIQYIAGEKRRQEELKQMVDTADASAPEAPAEEPADD